MGNQMTFVQDFSLVLTGAVIFTASLTLRDFFVDIKNKYFPKTTSLGSRLIYTLLVVALLVLLAGWLRTAFGLVANSQHTKTNSDAAEPTEKPEPEDTQPDVSEVPESAGGAE